MCLCFTWRCVVVVRRLQSKEEVDEESSSALTEYHKFIFSQALGCLLDVPFILLSPFTLWRVGALFQVVLRPAVVTDGNVPALEDARVWVVCPSQKTLTGAGTMDGHGLSLRVAAKPKANTLQTSGVQQVHLLFAQCE